MLESICEIPVRDADGKVVAHVRVDEDDWLRYARYPWSLNDNGYAIGRGGRTVRRGESCHLLSRLIVGLEPGDERRADHVNRDRLDNRRHNLRIVDGSGNAQNVTPREGCASPHRGVTFHRHSGRWQARVTVGGKTTALGYFDNEDDAAAAARDGRARLQPFAQD